MHRIAGHCAVIVNKIVLSHHVDVRVVRVNATWSTESDCHRAISGEQGPPNSLPDSFVRFGQLRRFNTSIVRWKLYYLNDTTLPSVHPRCLSNYYRNSSPVENIFCNVYDIVSIAIVSYMAFLCIPSGPSQYQPISIKDWIIVTRSSS